MVFKTAAIAIIISLCGIMLNPDSSLNADQVPKVLFVSSYHSGYAWSDGIIKGALKGFGLTASANGKGRLTNELVTLKIVHMDTKRNTSETFKRTAAESVRNLIGEWSPDIVIASDDNASKYLIVPYYLNKELPIVFCGVNWDASVYGFPASNVTGMEEVSLAVQTIEMMREYAKGNRLGILGADTLSEHKTVENIKRKFNIAPHKEYYVNSFEQWQERFKLLQDEVDMILFTNYVGIPGWKAEAAKQYIHEQIQVPVGTMDVWVTDYALIGLTKVASEQGEWAAQAALRILKGESPKDIPMVTNHKADIYLNLKLAKKLGINFPLDLLNWVNIVE